MHLTTLASTIFGTSAELAAICFCSCAQHPRILPQTLETLNLDHPFRHLSPTHPLPNTYIIDGCNVSLVSLACYAFDYGLEPYVWG